MSHTKTNDDSVLPPADQPLAMRRLVIFALPLALTFLMMAGAAPLVSNGITWTYGAEGEKVHLAAFVMTFVLCLTIYSSMFIARNVAIRAITDRRSMGRYAVFFLGCASACSLIIVLVSQFDPLGHLIFGRLFQAELEVEHLARQGMLIFIPIPILVALRGLGQGCHISNHQSMYVGVGTALRLGAMATFVFGYAIHHTLTGPMLGGLTYLTGIATETVFVLATLINKPQWKTRTDGPTLTYGQYARYTFPLMAGSLCNQFMNVVLIYLISKGLSPKANWASFDLIRDTGWVMCSTLMAIMPIVVTHATSRANLRLLIRFGAWHVAAITTLVMLVALTPLRDAIFVGWLEVDNKMIRDLTYTALLWMIPVPVVMLTSLFVQSLHTRSGRTLWVTIGNLSGLVVLVGASRVVDLSQFHGVVVAMIGQAVFHLSSIAVLGVGLLNGGLAAAIAHVPLTDHFGGPKSESAAATGADVAGEPAGDTAPVPESVKA